MNKYVPIEGGWPADWPEHNAPCVGEIQRLPLPLFCYNPTLYLAGDGLRLIVKAGRRGARLWTIPLDAALDGNDCSVELTGLLMPCYSGYEDARHFRWRGRDHIAYATVSVTAGELFVRQCVGQLQEAPGGIAELWEPSLPFRRPVEKNWSFFEDRGTLRAVYDIRRGETLRFRGCRPMRGPTFRWSPQWSGGHMRGGASPVLHEGLWWSFFHGALDCEGLPSRFYSVGCYAFEPRPPFRPVCHTPRPIIVPPRAGWPRDLGVSVVWPGGAVMHNGQWLLALGIHETWSAVCTVDHQLLQRELIWR